jgi:Flp pilus assembly protein TadD
MDLPNNPRGQATSRRTVLLAIAIALLSLATLSPLFRADFANWDDKSNLLQNPDITQRGPGGLVSLWTHTFLDLYIPVTQTAWWVFARPEPLNPTLFHAFNVLAHIATAIVVFGILRAVISKPWPAACGAMIFAIHPVQVEAVGWVSGLKDVLAGLFGFAAIWIYIASPQSNRRTSLRQTVAIAVFGLALLSKPSAMVMPLIAASIAIFALNRPAKRTLLQLSPWFTLAVAAALIARIGQPAHAMAQTIPLWARPLIAADSLAFYLWKLLIPTSMVVVYGRTYPAIFQDFPHPAWWTWIFPAAVFALAWFNRPRWPIGWTAAVIFVAGLLPMLGLAAFDFQIYSNVTDHYVYPAMLGPALAFAGFLNAAKKPVIAAAAPPILAVLCILSFQQARTWMNDRAIFTHLLNVEPQSWVAMHELCDDSLSHRDYLAAEAEARAYVRENPGDPKAYIDLGNALRAQHRTDDAIQAFQHALQLNSASAWANIGLAQVYEDIGRFDLAMHCYQQALILDPANALASASLARAKEESAIIQPANNSN